MINKIYHHIAFTLFWGLVIAVIITSIMRWGQWDNQVIADCIDRGFSEDTCRGI